MSEFVVEIVTLAERVDELAARYQGLRAAARAIDVDAAYLHRLKGGSKTKPSDEILRKLGLRKAVVYTRIRAAAQPGREGG